jgi:tetrahydromethanopterin S-methyltransferase subunit D
MAALVWFTVGVALWHFTVLLPDRFWAGIVGALLGAVTGAMVSGAIAQVLLGESIGQTDFATVLYAIPGTIAGLAITYAIGVREEREAIQH